MKRWFCRANTGHVYHAVDVADGELLRDCRALCGFKPGDHAITRIGRGRSRWTDGWSDHPKADVAVCPRCAQRINDQHQTSDWRDLTKCCMATQQLAATFPGPYGGLYVGRWADGTFSCLDTDDPEKVPDDFDVLAQVTPDRVYPIGRAANYLRADGTVNF